MACPNYAADVSRIASENPEAFANCHTGNAHTEDFIRIVAAELHAKDSNVGLNGKRGDPNDISDDAINILDPDDGPGTTPEGDRCWVVDVVVSAGAPNATPGWNPQPDAEGSTGAWVKPGAPPTSGGGSGEVQPYPSEDPNGGWWGQVFDKAVAQLYADAGRVYPDPNDQKSLRWCGRTAYDIRDGMTKEDALAKHLKELKVALGIQPK
jgi:hypothetical protein